MVLPDDLGDLTKLAKLTISSCKSLRGLPRSFGRLHGLKTLLMGAQIDGMATDSEHTTACTALQGLPDLSHLPELKVEGLPRHLKPWQEGGRKAYHL